MRSEAAWSYLDPKPIFLYDPKYQAHLAFWNGAAMTRDYALMIFSSAWMSLYYSDSVKQAAWKEYNRVYRSGGFLTRDWDTIVDNQDWISFTNFLTRSIAKKDKKFFSKLRKKYSPKEAMSWFLPSREIILT